MTPGQNNLTWRTPTARLAILGTFCAIGLVCAQAAVAQSDVQRDAETSQALSPLEKLGQLHANAKRKIANWGRKPASQPSDHYQARRSPPERRELPRQTNENQQASYSAPAARPNYQDQSDDRDRYAPPVPPRGAPPQHYSNPRQRTVHPREEYPSLRDDRPVERYQPPQNPVRSRQQDPRDYPPVDHSTRNYPGETDYRYDSPPGPAGGSLMNEPAMRQTAFSPNSNGHLSNGSAMTRQTAGFQQTSASQRALKLEAENGLLKSARDSLKVENKRLQKLLTDNRQLLANIETGIQTAREALSDANSDNGDLKQQIAILERKQERQSQETARVLANIRNNLDDVLMHEITAKDGLPHGP